jgi:hypothetical protein
MMLQEDVQDAVILSVVVEIVPDMLCNKFVKKTLLMLQFNTLESSVKIIPIYRKKYDTK